MEGCAPRGKPNELGMGGRWAAYVERAVACLNLQRGGGHHGSSGETWAEIGGVETQSLAEVAEI